MKTYAHNFRGRIESLRLRIESLSGLRKAVALPAAHDISARQWFVIESELKAVEIRLARRLKKVGRAYLPEIGAEIRRGAAARELNAALGEIELEMSRAFVFFDTYADLLTQRFMPDIGRLLAGCDVLAADALRKDHPALAIVEPPLVYCDRGFGASTLREGVRLPGRGFNPIPLVQIPYSRLREKCNLTSIYHEGGHEVMNRLKLVETLPKALARGLEKAGANQIVRDSFALWSSEIGPDFWAFCACGVAQTATIREILALPPGHVFRIPFGDPHPPPYLRALLSFEWCRQLWGGGIWDEWEREWRELYPLKSAPAELREITAQLLRFVPEVGRILLKTKFRVLGGKPISSLFDLAKLAPAALVNAFGADGKITLTNLSPGAQLAAFRIYREDRKPDEEKLDRLMTAWLLKLGAPKLKQ